MKIEIENVVKRGKTYPSRQGKFDALLAGLPSAPPGYSCAELKQRVLTRLPGGLYPGGAKAGWWPKAA